MSDLKKRYRELAQQHHPDMPMGNAHTFRDVTAAFNILKAELEQRENPRKGAQRSAHDTEACSENSTSKEATNQTKQSHVHRTDGRGILLDHLWHFEGYELLTMLFSLTLWGAWTLDSMYRAARHERSSDLQRNAAASLRPLKPSGGELHGTMYFHGMSDKEKAIEIFFDERMQMQQASGIQVIQAVPSIDKASEAKSRASFEHYITAKHFSDVRSYFFANDPENADRRRVLTSTFDAELLEESKIRTRCPVLVEVNTAAKGEGYGEKLPELIRNIHEVRWQNVDAGCAAEIAAEAIGCVPRNNPARAKWSFIEYRALGSDSNVPQCLVAVHNLKWPKVAGAPAQRVVVFGSEDMQPALALRRDEDLNAGRIKSSSLTVGGIVPLKDHQSFRSVL